MTQVGQSGQEPLSERAQAAGAVCPVLAPDLRDRLLGLEPDRLGDPSLSANKTLIHDNTLPDHRLEPFDARPVRVSLRILKSSEKLRLRHFVFQNAGMVQITCFAGNMGWGDE